MPSERWERATASGPSSRARAPAGFDGPAAQRADEPAAIPGGQRQARGGPPPLAQALARPGPARRPERFVEQRFARRRVGDTLRPDADFRRTQVRRREGSGNEAGGPGGFDVEGHWSFLERRMDECRPAQASA